MKSKALISTLALIAGLASSHGAHAGLGFAWLTAAPVDIGQPINLGTAATGAQLTSGVQTITAETGNGFSGVRITSIEITGDPAESGYTGTCAPDLVLNNGESCTIQYQARSNTAGSFSEAVNIGCSPLSLIGTNTVVCTSPQVHFFHNLVAEFFAASPVPTMSAGSLTLMSLLMLAVGAYFGFRKN